MARKLFVSLEDDLETPEVVAEETVTVAENDAEIKHLKELIKKLTLLNTF